VNILFIFIFCRPAYLYYIKKIKRVWFRTEFRSISTAMVSNYVNISLFVEIMGNIWQSPSSLCFVSFFFLIFSSQNVNVGLYKGGKLKEAM
jgi:hypothetical protein